MRNNKDGSYQIDTFTENREAEVNRLKHQVDLFYGEEINLYRKLGLKDGMRIIECGSGPGFLIRNILKDLPGCDATALEIEPFLVEYLEKNSLDSGKKLYKARQGSVYETGLPDDYFDFAFARLVIEHLEEPENALREVRRILKPNGRFIIVSNDFAYHLLTYPHIPELDEMYESYIRSRISKSGDPLIARKLPLMMRKHGFSEITFDTLCVHSEFVGDKAFLKAENVNISKSLVKEGFLKKETLESLMESWYKMLQSPDHVIYRQLFAVSGVKTGSNRAINTDGDKPEKISADRKETDRFGMDDLLIIPEEDRKQKLNLHLTELVKRIMEKPDMHIEHSTCLNDVDIDSISATELTGVVTSEFRTDISIADILQKYSVNDISGLIISNLGSVVELKDESEDDESWLEGQL